MGQEVKDFLGGPRFLWRAHATNQENAYTEPPAVYTTGGEIVTGGMLGTETRVLSRPAARKSLEERGLPGCYLGAPRAEATSTVVDMARSAETGENGRVASPWGSGGRLKIAPDIADQPLTPMPGCGFQFPKPPVL